MPSKKSRYQTIKPGDILQIPYTGGAVYGRVVYCDSRATPVSRRRGLYLKVFDREVLSEEDLETLLTSPIMLGPLHCTDDLVKNSTWKVFGNLPLTDKERKLPYFLDGTGIVDYFYQRVPDTPGNRANVIDEFIVPPEWVVAAIQAKRGLEAWQPGYDCMLPKRG